MPYPPFARFYSNCTGCDARKAFEGKKYGKSLAIFATPVLTEDINTSS